MADTWKLDSTDPSEVEGQPETPKEARSARSYAELMAELKELEALGITVDDLKGAIEGASE